MNAISMQHRKLCRVWVLSMAVAALPLVQKSRSRANTKKDVRPGGMLNLKAQGGRSEMTCSGFSYMLNYVQ